MDPSIKNLEINMDATDLYREDTITDRRAGTIRRLTPITSDGADDSSRSVVYVGQAQLATPMGALPIGFEIDAVSLNDAIAKFPEAAKLAVAETVKEMKELQREAASSIVVPETGATGLGGPSGFGGPGGKIQVP